MTAAVAGRRAAAADTWAGAIRAALHENDGQVLLVTQAPKTVAFVAGCLLDNACRMWRKRTSL